MRHLFSPAGDAALAAVLLQKPLLAFDFDGTLAPIVPRPEDARASRTVAAHLGALAKRLPVAIVTGRAADDVRGRLGFNPDYVVGNHGAEDGLDPAGLAAFIQTLEPLRARLKARDGEVAAAGISVEDKGPSVALHYRLAVEQQRAQALIQDLLAPTGQALRVFAGKMVVNVMSADAPDKAHAVRALVARSGVGSALFAGDDVNDEPVFVTAPPNWLTVRVGNDDANSGAQFFIDGTEQMALMLQRIVRLTADLPP